MSFVLVTVRSAAVSSAKSFETGHYQECHLWTKERVASPVQPPPHLGTQRRLEPYLKTLQPVLQFKSDLLKVFIPL